MEPAGIDGLRPDVLENQSNISNALQAAWCLEDIGIWNVGPYNLPYFAAPVLCESVLAMTIEGVKRIQQVSSIPFCAEIPSFSIAAGDMTLGEFFIVWLTRRNAVWCWISAMYFLMRSIMA